MHSTKAQFFLFLCLYLLVRLFSFNFLPGSPVNTLFTVLYIVLTVYFITRQELLGWFLVAAEIILGGTGIFFEAITVSLRTWLLLFSVGLYITFEYKTIISVLKKHGPLLLLLGTVALGTAVGFTNKHSNREIIQAIIPYAFLLYYFPLRTLLSNDEWKKWCYTVLLAAIVSQTVFVVFTAWGFGSGHLILQDTYYHWFRDVAGGKITYVAYHFYRIVLNEQLLLVPTLLFFTAKLIVEKQKKYLFSTSALFIILLNILFAFSVTRIYYLALMVGSLLLITKENLRRSLTVIAFLFCTIFITFTSIYFISSGGSSLGLEVLGLRFGSIISPSMEDSSLSRLLLLPVIKTQIIAAPLLGSGFGTALSVYSPVLKQTITTNQFDWGYLQIIAELGLVGFLAWSYFLSKIFVSIKKAALWPLATFVALLVINITSPALFHVLGITWLILLQAQANYASPE